MRGLQLPRREILPGSFQVWLTALIARLLFCVCIRSHCTCRSRSNSCCNSIIFSHLFLSNSFSDSRLSLIFVSYLSLGSGANGIDIIWRGKWRDCLLSDLRRSSSLCHLMCSTSIPELLSNLFISIPFQELALYCPYIYLHIFNIYIIYIF